jgi:ribosomal protein S18 acetylase RimI-like enzyme
MWDEAKIEQRQARPSDEPFMRALHKAAYQDVVSRQFGSWNDEIQYSMFTDKWDPGQFEIIEIEGKPIGCISSANHPDEVIIAEIQIHPEYQGRGIGSELMKAEIARARATQRSVVLQVLHKNDRARAFYERLGFAVGGTTDTHYKMSLSP